MISHTKLETVCFEKPTVADGKAMWELVSQSTLDQNSAYKYILMCELFAETCIVAKENNKLIGFVTAFIPPEKQHTLFIWQIGVDSTQRGKGLGSKLLQELIHRQSTKVNYVEATVTPSNQASQALFRRLAKNYETKCQESDFFSKDLFPGEQHEEEHLFTIGPLSDAN